MLWLVTVGACLSRAVHVGMLKQVFLFCSFSDARFAVDKAHSHALPTLRHSASCCCYCDYPCSCPCFLTLMVMVIVLVITTVMVKVAGT